MGEGNVPENAESEPEQSPRMNFNFESPANMKNNPMQEILPEFLKDSDNLLILVLTLMLVREKANTPLIIALMSILMKNN